MRGGATAVRSEQKGCFLPRDIQFQSHPTKESSFDAYMAFFASPISEPPASLERNAIADALFFCAGQSLETSNTTNTRMNASAEKRLSREIKIGADDDDVTSRNERVDASTKNCLGDENRRMNLKTHAAPGRTNFIRLLSAVCPFPLQAGVTLPTHAAPRRAARSALFPHLAHSSLVPKFL